MIKNDTGFLPSGTLTEDPEEAERRKTWSISIVEGPCRTQVGPLTNSGRETLGPGVYRVTAPALCSGDELCDFE